eukprot:SAG31_NODE_885_length_11254_cov_14.613088_9_plen_736_part_00
MMPFAPKLLRIGLVLLSTGIVYGGGSGTCDLDGQACAGTAVQWTHIANADASSGGRIVKVSGGDARNAGAISTDTIFGDVDDPSKANGAEFTIESSGKRFRVGLSNDGLPIAHDGNIEYAIGMGGKSMLNILERGIYLRRKIASYSARDKVQVRLNRAGQVEFLHNGWILYVSDTPPTLPLRVEVSLLEEGASTSATFIYDNEGYDGSSMALFWVLIGVSAALTLFCLCRCIQQRRLNLLNGLEKTYQCQPPTVYADTARWLSDGKCTFEVHPFVSQGYETLPHAVVKLRSKNCIAINPLNAGINAIVAMWQRSQDRVTGSKRADATRRVLAEVLADMATWTVHVSAVHVAASGGGDDPYVAAYTIPAHDAVPMGTVHAADRRKDRPAYVIVDRAYPVGRMTEAIRKELNHLDDNRQGLHRVDSASLSRTGSVTHSRKGVITVATAIPPAYQFVEPPPPPAEAAAAALFGSQEQTMALGDGLIAYSPHFYRYVCPDNAPVKGSSRELASRHLHGSFAGSGVHNTSDQQLSIGQFADPNTNFRYAACCLLQTPIIDRTGTIVDPDVHVTILDPLPLEVEPSTCQRFFKGFSVSAVDGLPNKDRLGHAERMLMESGLSKLMASRAEDIFERASTFAAQKVSARSPKIEPFELCVLWSGGIDSTAALLALMSITSEKYKMRRVRLVVLYAERSIAEFESFFDSHIQGDAFCNDDQVFAARLMPEIQHKGMDEALQVSE